MSTTYAFINDRMTSYSSIKQKLDLSSDGRKKLDVLNPYYAIDKFVMPGHIIIVGDDNSLSCTREEADLMRHAGTVHHALRNNPSAADPDLVNNYDLLQSLLNYGSIGGGSSTGGWSQHLNQVKNTLEKIEALYQQHRSKGAASSVSDFITERRKLFSQLDQQLKGVAHYGTGLRKSDSIKRTLGISTRSYMAHGEIAGYAERIKGISRLSNALKKGTYIGIALDFASTSLEIKEACMAGFTEQCERARYVETGKLFGSVGGSLAGGNVGSKILVGICSKMNMRHGAVMLGCSIIGAAVGGWGGGLAGGSGGDTLGEIIYNGAHE